MKITKLSAVHKDMVKLLFDHNKYMGVDADSAAYQLAGTTFNALTYDIFCANYLSGLNNFHAFGCVVDDQVRALISFYESDEEPAWYYTLYRSSGDNNLLRGVLDAVIEYNETNNRLKFYTLVHARHSKLLRRFHWSEYNNNRYGYIDEFVVPAKTKCYYTNYWELLYKRFLLPEDSVVRCNYLKQEFRTTIPIGGNL